MDQTATQETGPNNLQAPEGHEVKIERGFSRSFMIKLSDGEIATRAREVSRLLRSIDDKEEARDRAKKQANNEIDELRAGVKRLSDEVHDGEERRDIPCERHFIYRLGVVQVKRTDTGEVVEERAMNARERQTELPLEDGQSDGAEESEGTEESDVDDTDGEGGGDDSDPPPELETAKAGSNGEESAGKGVRKRKSRSKAEG